jgi:hypothetical protein
MDLLPFRPWLVLLHVLGVLGFLMIHGVSVYVILRLRRERDRGRIRTLLDASASTQNVLGLFLLVFFVAGVLAGLVGPNWWNNGTLWLWVSLALFIGVMIGMTAFGAAYLNDLRVALGLPTTRQRAVAADAPAPADDAALAVLLASPRPLMVTAIGIGGIVVITWLMVAKPF